MKKIIILFLSAIFILSCAQKKSSKKATTLKYFNARNSTDFQLVKDLISDSLTVVAGDYVMGYSQDSYYEVFKWDSVFQTSYEIVDLKENEEEVIASISMSSIRNKFLQNDVMTCQYKLSFESGNITKIVSLDCKDANWQIWEKRVNQLVNWVELNHPELDGFIHDMTLNGAKKYLKAISLYEANEHDL